LTEKVKGQGRAGSLNFKIGDYCWRDDLRQSIEGSIKSVAVNYLTFFNLPRPAATATATA